MSDALTLSCVSKIYQSPRRVVHALHNINLQIREGEFVCVIGPSGSGKTTLLQVSAGYLAPDVGNVMVLDRNIYALPIWERLSLRNSLLGFAFQGDYLLEDLTTFENVELPLIIQGIPRRSREDKVHQALDAVGILGLANSRPTEVSGGEKRRISLARALVNGCRILFADEPTSNLDTATSTLILQTLRQLNSAGMTVVAATHDSLVADRADGVVKMRDGMIESLVSPSDKNK